MSVSVGSGVVGRWPVGVVVVGGDGVAALDLIAALQDGLGHAPTSGDFVALLRSEQFSAGSIKLAAAVSTPDGVRIFLRGGLEARTEANEIMAGDEPIERDLPSPRALWLGEGTPPTEQAHPVLDLRRGVVRGRGVVVYLPVGADADDDTNSLGRLPPPDVNAVPLGPPPIPDGALDRDRTPVAAETPEPTDISEPTESDPLPAPDVDTPSDHEVRPFVAVDWTDGDSPDLREPLPLAAGDAGSESRVSAEQVMGVRCSRDHFNNPNAGYCQVCGISMVHMTRRLEPGPRPTLGFVVFADGATYAIDRPYLIGRNPGTADGGMTPLAAQDSTQSVSREHAELRLDGWDVNYVDLGSTNGSYLWDPRIRQWTPLRPQTPLALRSGMTVSVGRMTFVFQGASKAVEEVR